MLLSEIVPETLSREQVARLVFGEPPPLSQQGNTRADGIFVFGGSRPERVVTAVRLYQADQAPFILFSGGTKFGAKPEPEAITMRRQALALGVPEKDILVETDSNHTKENVLASLLVLDRAVGLHRLRRLLVVSTPYHMRRCLLTLRTYMPRWVEYSWHPDDRADMRRDNWWQSSEGEWRVQKEARNLVAYVREGQLLDEAVDLGS